MAPWRENDIPPYWRDYAARRQRERRRTAVLRVLALVVFPAAVWTAVLLTVLP